MLRHTNRTPRSPLTCEDGLTLWRARDAYRVHRAWTTGGILFLGLEAYTLLLLGFWWQGLLVIGMQLLTVWGLRWVLHQGWRWARRWWSRIRSGTGYGMVLVLVLLGSGTVSGCHGISCGVLGLHGYSCDANAPVACTKESRQLGYCGGVAAGASEQRSQ
jgi:hypothetical protein